MPKISELAASTTLTDDDLILTVDAPGGSAATKKITAANAKAYFGAPADLLVVEMTGVQTSTDTTVGGEPFSPAFGGNFTIVNYPNVTCSISLPLVFASVPSWVRAYVELDGDGQGDLRWLDLIGGGGGMMHGVFDFNGLSAGVHTVAVHKGLDTAGTATYVASASQQAIIRISERG